MSPTVKRKINGIVHDESATGKTVFIEPTEVVEANNKVRELEAAERREIVRILTVFSDELRPQIQEILNSYNFLAQIDLIYAKTELAKLTKAFEPEVKAEPHLDWIRAIHPLLQLSLEKQGKKVVPLDIRLEGDRSQETGDWRNVGRLLIISGPNAGGKSVCLKTVGLLQYMLQCGLSIPIGDRSTTGIFENIMIDIGDEQSIENDLSTYSSHLLNMKQMMKQANARTILLIDEFGGGTEPTIGGAIAEAVLKQFWEKKTFGVITTHYQNLKHFAEDHEGVVNGAMLYDRGQMQALFQLSIGHVRDKRYWEGKRQTIHQHEKSLEGHIQRYETNLEEIERERKEILRRAQEQAEELLAEANRKIENAIREIKEAQAEKERTRIVREELQEFRQQVASDDTRGLMSEEDFAKKLRQMEERKARKAQRKERKGEEEKAASKKLAEHAKANKDAENRPLETGDTVRIKGLNSVGKIESIQGKQATVIFGDVRSKIKLEQLERTKEAPKESTSANKHEALAIQTSKVTRATMEDRRHNFHQDLDVRGMRGDEAIDTVMHFIDDAILIGMSRVRILHGTGSGILRQLIRQYLNTVPNVTKARDEHVQFGGAGITVVDLD